MTQMKHLSIVDGAFLHLESAEMPMHVGSLNLFEPPAGYAREPARTTSTRAKPARRKPRLRVVAAPATAPAPPLRRKPPRQARGEPARGRS